MLCSGELKRESFVCEKVMPLLQPYFEKYDFDKCIWQMTLMFVPKKGSYHKEYTAENWKFYYNYHTMTNV